MGELSIIDTKGGGSCPLYASRNRSREVLRVLFKYETASLAQKPLVELFEVGVSFINKHLNNIFATGQLSRKATVSKMEIVGREGGREIEFKNIDAIIGVGYRVN